MIHRVNLRVTLFNYFILKFLFFAGAPVEGRKTLRGHRWQIESGRRETHRKIRRCQDRRDICLPEKNGSPRSWRGAQVMRYITTRCWILWTSRRWSSRKFPIPAARALPYGNGCRSRPPSSTFNPWLDLVPSVTVVSRRDGPVEIRNSSPCIRGCCCIVLHRVASPRRASLTIVTHASRE